MLKWNTWIRIKILADTYGDILICCTKLELMKHSENQLLPLQLLHLPRSPELLSVNRVAYL